MTKELSKGERKALVRDYTMNRTFKPERGENEKFKDYKIRQKESRELTEKIKRGVVTHVASKAIVAKDFYGRKIVIGVQKVNGTYRKPA